MRPRYAGDSGWVLEPTAILPRDTSPPPLVVHQVASRQNCPFRKTHTEAPMTDPFHFPDELLWTGTTPGSPGSLRSATL